MKAMRYVLALVLLCSAGASRAADLTEVATMLDPGNPYDARLTVGFRTTWKFAALNREYQGNGRGIEVVKDLLFQQVRAELDLRAEFAIFKDLALYVALPIVLKQQATYKFASGSTYPGYPGEADCRAAHPEDPWVCNPDGVNVNNSRTVQDGLAAGLQDGLGYDPNGPALILGPEWETGAGEAGPRTLFDGPARSGLDQLHIGIHGLVFNEKRHPERPTWLLGAEFRLSVGKVMDFKRNNAGDPEPCGAYTLNNWNCRPELNNAVSKGIHEVQFYTTVSKRLGRLDSFVHFYFRMPFAYRDGSFYSSKYDFSAGWGEDNRSPVNKAPKVAGLKFGTEVVAWEEPVQQFKLAISILGSIDYRFPGRDYSEAYEILAGSPILNMNCGDPHSLLYDSLCQDPSVRRALTYYPGVTWVQDYAIFGGRLSIDFLIYKYLKFQLAYGFVHEQEHFLTTADAGNDFGTAAPQNGTCPSGEACADGRVNIPSKEQNPWHRPAIDTPGHRYRVQKTMIHQLWISLQGRF